MTKEQRERLDQIERRLKECELNHEKCERDRLRLMEALFNKQVALDEVLKK